MSVSTVSNDQQQKTFLGQPRALANLFGVEMWERFSFYGMQGILLIYLYYSVSEGGLGMGEAAASGIVGAYGGLVRSSRPRWSRCSSSRWRSARRGRSAGSCPE